MAGDFENIDAAWDFVSAGGIPSTAVTSGGQIIKMRIEHVWVEAALPYYPSKGTKAVSTRNPIDTWVPIDPSYKQYTYLTGLDTQTIVNLDGEQIGNNFIASGTINEQEGWVQGLNSNIIEQAQTQAQQKLEAHINGMTDPTVGDVIGGRTINQQTFDFFPSSLPYPKFTRAISYSELPDNLRTRVTLGLGWDRIDQSYQYSKTIPLYLLNQRNLTISFKPASTADENALIALMPEGEITELSQVPNFLPSSIRAIPMIKRDSEVLLSGDALSFGEEVRVWYKIEHPKQVYFDKYYDVIVGSYLALGIVGSNISLKNINSLQSIIDETYLIIETKNTQKYASLTQERLFGNMFIPVIQSYYGQYISFSKKMSMEKSMSWMPLPTIGAFGFEPYQRTLLGLNRGIEAHGFFMDARTVQILNEKNGDSEKKKQLMMQIGLLSSHLEHFVPEQFFNEGGDFSSITEGFSTAKAFEKASQQGQRIYKITQANQSTALSNIKHDALAMNEIRNALQVGKEVITHTDPITVQSYKGSGYIILDPETGEGAYKISGGKNGGFQAFVENAVIMVAAALGFVDGRTGLYAGQKFMFSESLKYLAKISKVSAALGFVGILVSLAYIWTDDGLSLASKIGQTAMTLLTFGITTVVVGAVAASGLALGVAAVIGLFVGDL